MIDQQPKLLLIIKVPSGLKIMDTPRPQSQGGHVMRIEAVGKQLYGYEIHNIAGVPYARLVPQNPVKPEWVRVAEADGSVEYVDVVKMEAGKDSIAELADAVTLLATAVRELARK